VNAVRINYSYSPVCHMIGTEVCTSIFFFPFDLYSNSSKLSDARSNLHYQCLFCFVLITNKE
jgi:hypothetical protein